MIPPFDPVTGNLPPGEHAASWADMEARYAITPWRRQLLAGLLEALILLRKAGCKRAYVDGSFVTAKVAPADFDACWDVEGVDLDLVDERLLTFDTGRKTQKQAFKGELFLADMRADAFGTLFRDFFQADRDGNPKGIIVIELKDLP